MKNLKWNMACCLLAVLFFVSCGYRFEGGGYLKDTVMRVYVESFENKSSETGAGVSFTNLLVQEILRKTDTKVVDKASADAVLKGTVKTITFETLSRSSTESIVERRVFATVDLKLMDKNDDVIWSVKDFSSYEDYSVSADKVSDDANKKDTVDEIAAKSAERLVNKMLVNF